MENKQHITEININFQMKQKNAVICKGAIGSLGIGYLQLYILGVGSAKSIHLHGKSHCKVAMIYTTWTFQRVPNGS